MIEYTLPFLKYDPLHALIQAGLLNQEQAAVVLKEHQRSGSPVETLVVTMHFMTESALTGFWAKMCGVEKISLHNMVLDAALIRQIPQDVCEKYLMIPISQVGHQIKIAMADVDDVNACDKLRQHLAHVAHSAIQIIPVLASQSDILEAIQQYYGLDMSIDGLLKELDDLQVQKGSLLEESTNLQNPTVRLIQAITLNAVKQGASDIHYEPEEFFVRIRYRIDGILCIAFLLHKTYWPALCVCLKVMAQIDIGESRRPQDGNFSLGVMGRAVDFRVSAHPTFHGENLVVRILDKSRSLLSLEELGYEQSLLRPLKRCLQNPEGMVIVTGPTGCGKTTTLYSMLSFLSTERVNVMTLEDPLEYSLPLIRQTAIQERAGLTFIEGMRSILRQDPDILLIGEIRDAETASMALRAAMTGHQILTTLHTTSALGAIHRLLNLGLHPTALAGQISCVIAQRLVRRLCPFCKVQGGATPEEQELLGLQKVQKVWHAVGCAECHHTGYHGRRAVAELLTFDEPLNTFVAQGAPTGKIAFYLKSKGVPSLLDAGLALLLKGETTPAEVVRVLGTRGESLR